MDYYNLGLMFVVLAIMFIRYDNNTLSLAEIWKQGDTATVKSDGAIKRGAVRLQTYYKVTKVSCTLRPKKKKGFKS